MVNKLAVTVLDVAEQWSGCHVENHFKMFGVITVFWLECIAKFWTGWKVC
jgi:hypothetical protein